MLPSCFKLSQKFGFTITSRRSPFFCRMMSSSSKPRVLIPIANGSEEIESVTIMNTLVRAGAEIVSASVEDSLQITGSRGIKIVADKLIGECLSEKWDLIACPGGMPGAERLRDSEALRQLLLQQAAEHRPVAAICASPAVIFQAIGLLDNKKATCYPAPKFISSLKNYSDEVVVVDGNIITSQGPATTLQFSLKLVEILFGSEKAVEVGNMMLFKA